MLPIKHIKMTENIELSKEDKQEIDKSIVDLFEWIKEGDKNNSILYIRGDNEAQTATLSIKGDVVLLANTFIHHMDKNDEFRQFFLSVFGSYLSKHPTQEYQFLAMLKRFKETCIAKFN
jgi:hypothetical protein